MVQVVQHHEKYLELHGEDKIVLMTRSEHKLLHNRLRRENKCHVPVDVMNSISMHARNRSPLGKRYDKDIKKAIWFAETVMPYLQLVEVIRYNLRSGNVRVDSFFHCDKSKGV